MLDVNNGALRDTGELGQISLTQHSPVAPFLEFDLEHPQLPPEAMLSAESGNHNTVLPLY